MNDPEPATTKDAAVQLIEALLGGELQLPERLAMLGAAVPPALRRLYSAEAEQADGLRSDCSAELLALCQATTDPAIAIAIAAPVVLRLHVLAHDDPAWSGLLPRLLVPGLPPVAAGIGLLALAVSASDRLPPEDHADLMLQALRLLPAEAPLRMAQVHQFALHLALRGMLRRLDGILDLPAPGDCEPEVQPQLLAECFFDAVICGRTCQASFLARRLEATPETAWHTYLVHLHRLYLAPFAAIVSGQPLPESEAPSMALFRAIRSQDHAFLDGWNADPDNESGSPLLAYDSLRVALVRRDHESARRLMDERIARFGRHWLDGLFIARLLLLEGRIGEAAQEFARLRQDAERYDGLERVEIELRLSQEMTCLDCCLLGGGTTPSSPPQPGAASEAEAMLAGDSPSALVLRARLDALALHAPPCLNLIAPSDGSARMAIALLQRRWGLPLRRLECEPVEGWRTRLAEAMRQGSHLLLIDAESLTTGDRAALVEALEAQAAPPSCRMVVCSGTTSRDDELHWLLADSRLVVPRLTQRRQDIPDIIGGLLRVTGSQARLDLAARQVFTDREWPGGWAELRAAARMLARRTAFAVDGRLARQIHAELSMGRA